MVFGEDQVPFEDVEDLLHRRSDLSTFLVHYTRPYDGKDAKENLVSMLTSRTIEARSVYGIMKALTEGDEALAATQRCVCFTETPLEHAWMMCRPIKSRAHPFAPYGIAYTKAWGRREGVNPVWYLDQTKGHQWITQALDDLRDLAATWDCCYALEATSSGPKVVKVPVHEAPIAKVAPFIEQMMPETKWGTPKEFWWEREWRKVGNLAFPWSRVVAAFAPEETHEEIQATLRAHEAADGEPPKLLDANWGLERMIAKLAGVPDSDAGPFPKPS